MEFTGSPFVMLWAGRGMAIAIGAAAGYGFYKLVGCRTGGCPITSNPWLSTLYGAFLGGMMFWH